MDLSENALRKHQHSIHDPISKVLIPVRSSADSRIGQFALSHGLSASGFDQLISLLSDPEIRTSEITFSSGADFVKTVAEYKERLQPNLKPSVSPLGFPSVVLDGVLDVMRQYMGAFVDAVDDFELDVQHEDRMEYRDALRRTLRNMALVQRSWVQPVHGLLHMRYCCTNETIPTRKGPRRAVAVAIRELAVDYRWDEDSSLRPLINLLRHLPNLRSLSIGLQDGENRVRQQSMRSLFQAIGRLSNLEMLLFPSWRQLIFHSYVPTPLLEMCEALSNLPKLSVLWLSHLHYSGTDAETQLLLAKLANLKPPSLKTLILNTPLHRSSLPGVFLRWISSSHIEPSLENLIMSPDIPTDPDMALDLGNGPGFSRLRRVLTNRSTYDAIYPLAKDLKALYLSIVKDTLPDRLPPRLTALLVQFSTGHAQTDEVIVSLLKRSDTVNLERIELDEVSSPLMFDWNGQTIFPLLTDFCRSSSVELDRYYSGYNERKCFGELVKFLLP